MVVERPLLIAEDYLGEQTGATKSLALQNVPLDANAGVHVAKVLKSKFGITGFTLDVERVERNVLRLVSESLLSEPQHKVQLLPYHRY